MIELRVNEPPTIPPPDALPLSDVEFFQRFTETVSTASEGDRISIATMCFDPRESVTEKLAYELIRAGQRGADIRIALDDYGFLLPWARGLTTGAEMKDPKGLAARNGLEWMLSESGAHVTVTNKDNRIGAPVYAGRSHIKIYAVNDEAYLSGHNLYETWRADTAVLLRRPEGVEMLHSTVEKLVAAGTTTVAFGGKDQQLVLPDGGELLLDAGEPGQSLIMEEALALIDDAEESITMTTQYFPRGGVARRLQAAARRGVHVNAVCASPHARSVAMRLAVGGIRSAQRLVYGTAATGHYAPRELPLLHSKVLMSEKAAIVGSHNFDPTGVRLGNAEVSYLSRDPAFVAKLGKIVLAQTTLP